MRKGWISVLLSTDMRRSLAEAAAFYAVQVDAAAHYLAGRGITPEIARHRQLGYVGEPRVGDEQYRGRVSIAYQTPSGVVDIRYRALDPDASPKMLSRPGAETRMYGVGAFTIPGDTIAICEGEFDSIIVQDLCGIPAVGIPGAHAWKPHYWRAFEDYTRVLVFCDGDSAGKDFGKRVASAIQQATVITMPDGMDANDVYLQEGPDGVRKRAGL